MKINLARASRFSVALAVLVMGASSAFASKPVKLSIGSGTAKDKEANAFTQTTLTAKAGSPIELTFKNNATAAGMQHNFVVVKPGKEQAVATASMTPPNGGADKGWLAVTPDVVANTKLLNPGESQTITFTINEPGNYPFICTFPGHYMTMKGILKVTK